MFSNDLISIKIDFFEGSNLNLSIVIIFKKIFTLFANAK